MAEYPENIEFEIDRLRLKRYLRISWLFKWIIGVGGTGAFISIFPFLQCIENRMHLGEATNYAISINLGALLLSVVCYSISSHFRAAQLAKSLKLRVEGAFLVLNSEIGLTKGMRRLHFRAVTDFAVRETFLMEKFGVKELVINTTASPPNSILAIPGLIDCNHVCVDLSKIDSEREK